MPSPTIHETPALPRAFPLHSSWGTVSSGESSFLLHILLTEACNLACTYCYQSSKPHKKLNLPLIEQKMREQIRLRTAEQKLSLRFFGGEPLLSFDALKALKASAELYWVELGRPRDNLKFGLTTNGTLLNNEMKAWFAQQPEVVPSLSLDGTPELHNANRSNSYSTIEPHLTFFQQYGEPVKMTIGPASIGLIADGVKHIHSLGFECHANLAFERIWQDEADHKRMLKAFAEDLAELVDFYRSRPEFKRTTLLLPLPATLPGDSNHPTGPALSCGMGRHMVALDTEGEVWPCDRIAPMMRTTKQVLNFERTHVAPDKCATCPFQPSCPECRAANLEEHGDLNHKTIHHCEFTQLQLRASALLSLSDLIEWKKKHPLGQLREEEKELFANRINIAQRVMSLTDDLWQEIQK